MATVRVAVTNKKLPKLTKRMRIETIDGKDYVDLPFAPRNITYGGFGWNWEQVSRPGRRPLNSPSSIKLKTMSFQFTLAARMPDVSKSKGNAMYKPESQQSKLNKFSAMANSLVDIRVTYSNSFDSKLWHITNFEFETVKLDPHNNEITEAVCTMELTEVQGNYAPKGPVSGGVSKPKTGTPKKQPVVKRPTKAGGEKKTVRTHTVRRGQTLSGIAIQYYRNADKWRMLADKNNIRNPHLIYPGQKIKIY